jgi:hypothetical protein
MKQINTIAQGMAAPLIAGAAALVWGLALLAGCGSSPDSEPKPAVSAGADELDAAIREASNYLNGKVPKGSKAVFLNIRSDYPGLSEYILGGLSENAVNDGVFSVVDREQLDTIRAELHFQMSGEVSDESAQSIGQMLGAQSIVSGTVSKVGPLYRIQIKAIAVQTAAVQGQWSRNVPNGTTIAALTEQHSPAASRGTASAASGGAARSGGAATGGASQGAGRQPASAAPAPQTQLFVGTALQGEMDLLDALDWISQNAASGGTYTIALGRDYAITPTELDNGGKTITLTLKSAGDAQHTVTFEGASPSYSLFIVKSGVTLTLEDGVTLRGTQNGYAESLVEVDGGKFVMNGGAITGNRRRGVYVKSGTFTMSNGSISGNKNGGVYASTFTMSGGAISGNTSDDGGGVHASTFTMSGGTISGNTSSSNIGGRGGGVHASTFTMSGGAISGNTSYGYGGGVYASTFTMSGGTISGNTSDYEGGGVYASTFTKSGTGTAVIYGSTAPDGQALRAGGDARGHAVYANKKRNTTARAATAMDSSKDGPSGGWE